MRGVSRRKRKEKKTIKALNQYITPYDKLSTSLKLSDAFLSSPKISGLDKLSCLDMPTREKGPGKVKLEIKYSPAAA